MLLGPNFFPSRPTSPHRASKVDFKTNTNGSFNTSDPSTFATGSKDTLPITGLAVQHRQQRLSKSDVMNAYAASYIDPASDEEIMYFALERNANTGTANVASGSSRTRMLIAHRRAAAPLHREHVDGDLLSFRSSSNGGAVSTIDVYRWDGGARRLR